ncbi:MAG: DUF1292 domain-containing protein [Clostridiales bacterium]|nr:DUF1292 domain-containing protein [Clostridiales bacterium]MCD8127455.1 DUF1292 domain-containing protein [Clostridiales bacterium]
MSDEQTMLPEDDGLPEDLNGTFMTLIDEEGNDLELEYVDTLEYNGGIYMAFYPTVPEGVDPDTVEDDEDYGLIILRVVSVDGEDQLETISDEVELQAVYDRLMEELFEEDEEEEGE